MSRKIPESIGIDILGDGVYIPVPVPIGNCGTCKYRSLQIFIGTHYFHQPLHSRCKGCNIANGMKKYDPCTVDWSKVTALTEEHNVVRSDLKEDHKKWKSRKKCGW